MCVAVPLEVLELVDGPLGPSAVVDIGGVRQAVPLTVCDRIPQPGEYLLVHAGFAIRAIPAEAALETLRLMEEAAGAPGGEAN